MEIQPTQGTSIPSSVDTGEEQLASFGGQSVGPVPVPAVYTPSPRDCAEHSFPKERPLASFSTQVIAGVSGLLYSAGSILFSSYLATRKFGLSVAPFALSNSAFYVLGGVIISGLIIKKSLQERACKPREGTVSVMSPKGAHAKESLPFSFAKAVIAGGYTAGSILFSTLGAEKAFSVRVLPFAFSSSFFYLVGGMAIGLLLINTRLQDRKCQLLKEVVKALGHDNNHQLGQRLEPVPKEVGSPRGTEESASSACEEDATSLSHDNHQLGQRLEPIPEEVDSPRGTEESVSSACEEDATSFSYDNHQPGQRLEPVPEEVGSLRRERFRTVSGHQRLRDGRLVRSLSLYSLEEDGRSIGEPASWEGYYADEFKKEGEYLLSASNESLHLLKAERKGHQSKGKKKTKAAQGVKAKGQGRGLLSSGRTIWRSLKDMVHPSTTDPKPSNDGATTKPKKHKIRMSLPERIIKKRKKKKDEEMLASFRMPTQPKERTTPQEMSPSKKAEPSAGSSEANPS